MRRTLITLFALLPLSLALAACQTGVSQGAACTPGSGDPTATDGTYVMVCRDSRWTPIMTAQEFVRLARGEDVVIAPLPPLGAPATTVPSPGPPATTPPTTTAPVPVGTVSLAGGSDFTCALSSAGGVRCWGAGTEGQLGNGLRTSSDQPVDVSGLSSGVVEISASWTQACARTTVGEVRCWGTALGANPAAVNDVPVTVPGLSSGVTSVAVGQEHACAVTAGGGAMCWGKNGSGKLGDGSATQRSQPVAVVGLSSGVRSVAPGSSHTCALLLSGALKCWGNNAYGAFGDGTTTSSPTPVDVTGLTDAVSVSAGNAFSCALSSDGAAHCWGGNFSGRLGDGTTTTRTTPTGVLGLDSGVATLAAGLEHACARLDDGTVRCWGVNGYGQVGNGTTSDVSTPSDAIGVSTATGLFPAARHSCVLSADGSATCWGRNDTAQLGDGTTTNRSTPVQVSVLDWEV